MVSNVASYVKIPRTQIFEGRIGHLERQEQSLLQVACAQGASNQGDGERRDQYESAADYPEPAFGY